MLTMTKDDYEKILAHCKEGLPNEACGLIGGTKDGDEKHIKKVYLLTNIDESNEHFSMDPKEQLAAVKDMRANGYQLYWQFAVDISCLAIFIHIRNLLPGHPKRTSVWHTIPK